MIPRAVPGLHVLDFLSPVLVAMIFVLVLSLVREPARQRFNAIFVAGAGAAYFSSGVGGWELAFAALETGCAYLGLRSYRWIGVAWLLHSGWDLVHHFYADPIILFAPTSSAGCAIIDALIALWFLARALSVYAIFEATRRRGPPSSVVRSRW
jgi:uncharacterized protein DUF6010